MMNERPPSKDYTALAKVYWKTKGYDQGAIASIAELMREIDKAASAGNTDYYLELQLKEARNTIQQLLDAESLRSAPAGFKKR